MLLSILFFFTSFVTGLAIHETSKLNLKSTFKYPFSLIIGTALTTVVIFIVSLFFGMNLQVIILSTIIILIFTVFSLRHNLDAIPGKWEVFSKTNALAIASLLILSTVIVLLFSKSIFQSESTITAGNRLVWTDWPIHFAITNAFVKGNNFPPQNPQFAGENLAYPFLADFLSGILIILGASLSFSYILPGIILAIASMSLLYYLGIILTSNKNVTAVGILIAVFWGGLGFIYLIQDIQSSGSLLSTLIYPAHEYTFYQEKNLWFFSFLYSEILPQRSFLFGLPLFLISFILMILGLNKTKKRYVLFSGLLIGIMPFFHTHSYISILMLSSVYLPLFLVNKLKDKGFKIFKENLAIIILFLVLPITGFALIQLPLFSSLDTKQTIGLNWGWMKGSENFIIFWFKNTGFFWPLWVLAIFKAKVSSEYKSIAIASIILFVLPNIFRFASWPYDNLKIFTYWYLIGAFLVASSLYFIAKKGIVGKVFAFSLFVSLVLSGIIEVSRVVLSDQAKIVIWSQEDIYLASVIENNTEPDAIILTAPVHNHPVSALAGRKVVIGFPGNAWSWGYSSWQSREADVRKMMQAPPYSVQDLMNKYNIDYVLISPWEKNYEPNLNYDYFQENYQLIIGNENFNLFRIQ